MDKSDVPFIIVKHMGQLGEGRDEAGAYMRGVKDACMWLDSELQAKLSIGAIQRAEIASTTLKAVELFEKALKCMKGEKK